MFAVTTCKFISPGIHESKSPQNEFTRVGWQTPWSCRDIQARRWRMLLSMAQRLTQQAWVMWMCSPLPMSVRMSSKTVKSLWIKQVSPRGLKSPYMQRKLGGDEAYWERQININLVMPLCLGTMHQYFQMCKKIWRNFWKYCWFWYLVFKLYYGKILFLDGYLSVWVLQRYLWTLMGREGIAVFLFQIIERGWICFSVLVLVQKSLEDV